MKIAIVGAGGFAREVADLARLLGMDVAGFVGEPVAGDPALRFPLLGGDEALPSLRSHGVEGAIVAVGKGLVRERLLAHCDAVGLALPVVVHPSATILTSIAFGAGTIVYPGAVVMTDCRIGRGVLLNSGATLGHDVVIGDCASVNPGAHLAGRIRVGARSVIGIGTSIREGVRIGADTTVGAGSVVVKDLPDGVVAYGVPAAVRSPGGSLR